MTPIKHDDRAEACQQFYETLIVALRYVAYRCGYALATHGSLKRDIDLVAVPWRDSAVDAHHLAGMLRMAAEAIVGTAREREGDKNPTEKPCGRLAWSFYLTHDDRGPYLDVSVMPIVRKEV